MATETQLFREIPDGTLESISPVTSAETVLMDEEGMGLPEYLGLMEDDIKDELRSEFPATLPPSGEASGDLAGTYPSPNVVGLTSQLKERPASLTDLFEENNGRLRVDITTTASDQPISTYGYVLTTSWDSPSKRNYQMYFPVNTANPSHYGMPWIRARYEGETQEWKRIASVNDISDALNTLMMSLNEILDLSSAQKAKLNAATQTMLLNLNEVSMPDDISHTSSDQDLQE